MKKLLLLLMSLTLFFVAGCGLVPTPSQLVPTPSHLAEKVTKTQQGYTVTLSNIKQSREPPKGRDRGYSGYDEINFFPYTTKLGNLSVVIKRGTIGAANLEFFSYVLKKDGRTISKWSGEREQAEMPIGNRLWWNIIGINTKGILKPGVYTLYVKDHVRAIDVREDGLSIFKITVTK